MSKALLLVAGNQLFAAEHLPPPDTVDVFMAEDMSLCTYVRHHQQKIVLFLAAMRAYADELRGCGYSVNYVDLDPSATRTYEDQLAVAITAVDARELHYFEIEDKPFRQRIEQFASAARLSTTVHASPMFLTSAEQFAALAGSRRPLRMADFYRRQRQRLNLLLDADGKPAGGRWSFDADNRKRLPKRIDPPSVPVPTRNKHVAPVIKQVAAEFDDHPGDAADFWWPTTRAQAQAWLDDFIEQRLPAFGPYEDALSERSDTVFHSLLSPALNMGLLTPQDILDRLPEPADDLPLQSLEGFIRQVIGWREFIRGVYHQQGDEQEAGNFWQHERELTDAWYDGTTGIAPLDAVIRSSIQLGWAHHIPRLMVLGNLMTLCEIRPSSAHRYFMELYVDSSEWVMGPNVYGMGLFSDGGVFATKPYICGSNYLVRMSDFSKGPWCDTVDGLYWRFIDRHHDFFASNPRLALMPRALDRLKPERRERIFAAAESFLEDFTQ